MIKPYIRIKSTIFNPEGETTVYASLNKAKKASRGIQIAAGGLGKGSLIVKGRKG